MKVFAIVLLAGLASALPTDPIIGKPVRQLAVYGSPAHASRSGEVLLDGVLSAESKGWRSLYDRPFVMAVQQDNKPELAAFLVKGGLSSLPHSEDMNFLHSVLRNADEKVGILLSATKFVNVPQVDMPITKFFLPKDYSLAKAARLHAEHESFPIMLLANKADLKGFDLSKLALIGDFHIFEDSVKIASDVAVPTTNFAIRKGNDLSAKRYPVPVMTVPLQSEFAPRISPYATFDYVIPTGISSINQQPHIAKYPVFN